MPTEGFDKAFELEPALAIVSFIVGIFIWYIIKRDTLMQESSKMHMEHLKARDEKSDKINEKLNDTLISLRDEIIKSRKHD